ncbi:unnamed protein product, partial [Rotaria magnacalcarata]
GIVSHDNIYSGKCLIRGALACVLTHFIIPPLDADLIRYRNLIGRLKTTIHEEGSRTIWNGWEPTILDYSPQGALKFGLYEVFKDALSNLAGDETSQKYRDLS